MRFFTTPFFLFILSFSINAQDNAKTYITSGIGVGEIKLGMSEEEATKGLQGTYKEFSYREQMKEYKKDTVGYTIDTRPPFVFGFDKCIVYDVSARSNHPVFNLYFLNHKLNFITITSYSVDDSVLNNFVLDGELSFHAPMEQSLEFLGCDYINLHYKEKEYDGNHLYYNRGLEVFYDDQKLAAICLFVPDRNFPLKMVGKRDQLINEFRSIDPTDE